MRLILHGLGDNENTEDKYYIYPQYDLPRFSLEQRTRGGLRVFKM